MAYGISVAIFQSGKGAREKTERTRQSETPRPAGKQGQKTEEKNNIMSAQIRTNRGGAWIGFAILAALILVAASASAQSISVCDNPSGSNCTDRDFSGTQYDPCPPGVVVPFTGRLHVVNNSHTNQQGTIFTNVLVQVSGQGIGQDPTTGVTTGVKYIIGNNLKANAKFPGPVTLRQRDKVISQGPGLPDNWFDTTVVRIDAQGNITKVSEDADCRG